MLKRILFPLSLCTIIAVVITAIPTTTKETAATITPVALNRMKPVQCCPNCGLDPGWTPINCGACTYDQCIDQHGICACMQCLEDCLTWCDFQEIDCGWEPWEVDECRDGCMNRWAMTCICAMALPGEPGFRKSLHHVDAFIDLFTLEMKLAIREAHTPHPMNHAVGDLSKMAPLLKDGH